MTLGIYSALVLMWNGYFLGVGLASLRRAAPDLLPIAAPHVSLEFTALLLGASAGWVLLGDCINCLAHNRPVRIRGVAAAVAAAFPPTIGGRMVRGAAHRRGLLAMGHILQIRDLVYQPVAKVGDSGSTRSIEFRTLESHGDGQETGGSTGVADVGGHGGPSDERGASVLRASEPGPGGGRLRRLRRGTGARRSTRRGWAARVYGRAGISVCC